MTGLIIFILGLIFGSFINVCIYRLPRNIFFNNSRSICPNCKKNIPWVDNIPLISFIILKAKCRFCKKNISSRYFIVELSIGFIFYTLFKIFGLNLEFIFFLILTSIFMIIFFIDLEHYIIPNSLTFPLIVLGFIKSFFLFENSISTIPIDAFLGAILGYGVIWVIIVFYRHIRKKEGMGLGDAKLLSVIGVWFGWKIIPFTIFFASVIGLIYAAPIIIKKKSLDFIISFGPFLILGLICSLMINIVYKLF